jgi:hypothetical protein
MDAWRAENAADYAQWLARKQKADALVYGSRSAAMASPLLMAVGMTVGLALGRAARAKQPGRRSSGSLAKFFGF